MNTRKKRLKKEKEPAKKEHLENIEERIVTLLFYCCALHSKVYYSQWTINFPSDYIFNEDYPYISEFMNQLNQFLKRKKYDPHYIWVIEKKRTNPHPHYHTAFLLDGHEIDNPYNLKKWLKKYWKLILERAYRKENIISEKEIKVSISLSRGKHRMMYRDNRDNVIEYSADDMKYLSKIKTKYIHNKGKGKRNFGSSTIKRGRLKRLGIDESNFYFFRNNFITRLEEENTHKGLVYRVRTQNKTPKLRWVNNNGG